MASLRRPSAAVPQRQPQQNASRQSNLPPVGMERRRDARQSKVGEKIKKRLSMRYAGPEPLISVVPPLPGQPRDFLSSDPYQNTLDVAMPGGQDDEDDVRDDVGDSKFGQFGSPEFAQSGFGGGFGASGGTVQDERIGRRGAADMTKDEEWDLEELGKEGVDVNAFIRRTLAGADEEEVKRFKAALMRHKQTNKKELQRSVFKNYAEFVVISKEISTLENDMLELKELLSEWKDVPQLMGMEDTLAPTLDKNVERRRTLRNSIVDLQQLYKSQVTNLWSTVEGSQKYLPLVPGRHLVFEATNFVELNAATYKAKQSVSMFLLNDLLMIAGKRRTKGATGTGLGDDKERERGRLVAERCWVLADLVVVDVKDSGDLTNALKIRRGKEVCVYRTPKPEDKKALLAAFRQVSQELGEKKRKDNEKEQERRKSMWQGDISALSVAPAMPGLPSSSRPLSTISMSLADSKDLRWIDEFGDDATMAIATRDWEEAVKLIEKGQELLKTLVTNSSAHTLLSNRLEDLKPTLIDPLAYDLSSPDLRKSTTSQLVAYLARLDRTDLARDTFLNARHDLMLKRVRGISFEGDISIYISELAIVCFTIIRHTSDWYMTAFKENKMASGFVTWAKEQIEHFSLMFRRQVYAPTVGTEIVDECVRVVASHNRKLLRDVGLDFTFLLSTLLQQDPLQTTSPHPVFQVASVASTPAPGYHIEPSPHVPYEPETPGQSGRNQLRSTSEQSNPSAGDSEPTPLPRTRSGGVSLSDDRLNPTPPARARSGAASLSEDKSNSSPQPRLRSGGLSLSDERLAAAPMSRSISNNSSRSNDYPPPTSRSASSNVVPKSTDQPESVPMPRSRSGGVSLSEDRLAPSPTPRVTAPLSIVPRSPRKPVVELGQGTGSPEFNENRPAPPPRSERRARAPPRASLDDHDSLR